MTRRAVPPLAVLLAAAALTAAILCTGCETGLKPNGGELTETETAKSGPAETAGHFLPSEAAAPAAGLTFGLDDGTQAAEPFPPELPRKLEEMASAGELSKQAVGVEVAEGYIILDLASGPLDGSGSRFAVLAVEQTAGRDQTGGRRLYVLRKTNTGEYETVWINRRLLRGAGEGGPFGDPYSGIRIQERALIVSEYGGSSFRWSAEYVFREAEGSLLLDRVTYGRCYTVTGGGTVSVYDYAGHRYTETASVEFEPDSELDGLLLMETPFNAGQRSFESVDSDSLQKDFPRLPLPSLGCYDYDGILPAGKELHRDAEEVLDSVKEERYGDMTKVPFHWTPETRENYSRALGYRAPGYYYESDRGLLSYFDRDGGQHTVLYEEKNRDAMTVEPRMEFYHVSDDGEQ